METNNDEPKKKPGRKPQWTDAKVEIMVKAIAAGKSYKDAYTAAFRIQRFTNISTKMRNLMQGLKRPNRNTKIGTIPNWSLTANVPCWNWYRVTNGTKRRLNQRWTKTAKW